MVKQALVCLAFFMGACGEASVTFRGRVSDGRDRAFHSFDVERSSGSEPPVAEAEVRLYISLDDVTCATADKPLLEASVLTDANGTYVIPERVFGGFPGRPSRILLCVEHPAFEPYTYHALYARTEDPMGGQKMLNFRLKPRADASLRE